MANSEYSRLRSIARKRIERLSAAGYAPKIHIPTVKELKASGGNMERATESLKTFLSSGQTVKQARVAESTGVGFKFDFNKAAFQKPKRQRSDAEKQRRRDRERYNRLKRKAYSMMGESYKKGDYALRHTKALKGLSQLDQFKDIMKQIPPELLPMFYDYMEVRFAQGVNIQRIYRYIDFVEDFTNLMKTGEYDLKAILTDFFKFVGDQNALRMQAEDLKDKMDSEEVDKLWKEFVRKKLRGR